MNLSDEQLHSMVEFLSPGNWKELDPFICLREVDVVIIDWIPVKGSREDFPYLSDHILTEYAKKFTPSCMKKIDDLLCSHMNQFAGKFFGYSLKCYINCFEGGIQCKYTYITLDNVAKSKLIGNIGSCSSRLSFLLVNRFTFSLFHPK